jgi:hypothetical protein
MLWLVWRSESLICFSNVNAWYGVKTGSFHSRVYIDGVHSKALVASAYIR